MGQAPKRRRLTEILLGVAALAAIGVAASVARGRGESLAPPPPRSSPHAAKVIAPPPPPLLSAPLPAPPPPRPLVIVAGGDVNFGRECGQAILSDPRYDPFRHMAPLWGDADLRFVNLESQLSDQKGETQSPRNRLIFTGPPGGGQTLAQAGIAVVSTANNHAWDYGRGALFETLDNLARAGVKQAGAGRTLDEAYAPAVLEVRGKRIAVVAVTHIWNAGDIEQHEGRKYVAWARQNRVKAALQRARREADFVLLSYHGGAEYIDAPVGGTRKFIDAVVKTGLVDVVIGHHPHVPQGVGFVRGRPVFYSLGNFVFAGHDWAPWTLTGLVARIELDAERAVRVSACAVALDGHVPKPIPAGAPELERVREHLRETSTSVGGVTVGAADARGCFPLTAPAR